MSASSTYLIPYPSLYYSGVRKLNTSLKNELLTFQNSCSASPAKTTSNSQDYSSSKALSRNHASALEYSPYLRRKCINACHFKFGFIRLFSTLTQPPRSDNPQPRPDVKLSSQNENRLITENDSPKWSRQLSVVIPIYRAALQRTTDSLARTRQLVKLLPSILPEGVSVTPTFLHRRSDISILGMELEDTLGKIEAEWVVHGASVEKENRTRRSNNKIQDDEETIILYFHGGAFFMCSAETHRPITSRLSEKTGCRILSVNYRLAPEFPFPYPLHDAISAYLSLVDPPPSSGMRRYKSSKIILAGDSAGGGLAIALALWVRDNAEKFNISPPGGIIALAPWLDLTHAMPSFWNNSDDYLPCVATDKQFLKRGSRSHYYTTHDSLNTQPLISPLFASDHSTSLAETSLSARDNFKFNSTVNNSPNFEMYQKLKSSSQSKSSSSPVSSKNMLPPTLIQIGSHERLRDESIAFSALSFSQSPIRVEIYQDMVHVFQVFATLGEPLAIHSLDRIGEFVRQISKVSPTERSLSSSPQSIAAKASTPEFMNISSTGDITYMDSCKALELVESGFNSKSAISQNSPHLSASQSPPTHQSAPSPSASNYSTSFIKRLLSLTSAAALGVTSSVSNSISSSQDNISSTKSASLKRDNIAFYRVV